MSHQVVFTARAQRDLDQVPPRVVPAIVEFAFGDLADGPRRVGKPLDRELTGILSARRGPYRVLYRVDDDKKRVTILRVAHRADAYRPWTA
ncbi:type II toxin-antitoxin system RelE family toxin [Pseudofrankia inefficax]|uniref:Plasmid stabilization system n=1 Tax=Pseudofrankia inefficax (strain DSM 45817 / CECT 9037 / DDB 130130 / EuI1c) TaxID=298654 RepID=E3IV74_PSEI1|nr:type II toxin-antitoxin system RelE/ParE family toxin [Pseudofrankia inefficax]ADP80094.1 plasmid stabilization system [Pseudofrankia inefficax]